MAYKIMFLIPICFVVSDAMTLNHDRPGMFLSEDEVVVNSHAEQTVIHGVQDKSDTGSVSAISATSEEDNSLEVSSRNAEDSENIPMSTGLDEIPVKSGLEEVPMDMGLKEIPMATGLKEIPMGTGLKEDFGLEEVPMSTGLKDDELTV